MYTYTNLYVFIYATDCSVRACKHTRSIVGHALRRQLRNRAGAHEFILCYSCTYVYIYTYICINIHMYV